MAEPWLICFFACNRGVDFGSGSGSKLNCAARVGRVGSDDLGYGPGSGFSFEPMQTSIHNIINLKGMVSGKGLPINQPIVLQTRPSNIQAPLQATRNAALCCKQIVIPLAQRITLWCPPLPAYFLKRELPQPSPLRHVMLLSIFLSIILLSYRSCSPEKLSPLKYRADKKCLCKVSTLVLVPVCSSAAVLWHAAVQLISFTDRLPAMQYSYALIIQLMRRAFSFAHTHWIARDVSMRT